MSVIDPAAVIAAHSEHEPGCVVDPSLPGEDCEPYRLAEALDREQRWSLRLAGSIGALNKALAAEQAKVARAGAVPLVTVALSTGHLRDYIRPEDLRAVLADQPEQVQPQETEAVDLVAALLASVEAAKARRAERSKP